MLNIPLKELRNIQILSVWQTEHLNLSNYNRKMFSFTGKMDKMIQDFFLFFLH